MTKTVTTWFGAVLLAIGVLGFIPGITTNNALLGLFAVNAANNILYIVTGLLAISMGMAGEDQSKNFFKVFGVIFALWAILGFMSNERVLGFLENNMATTVLNVIIALVALYFGFAGGASRSGSGTGSSSTSTPGASTT